MKTFLFFLLTASLFCLPVFLSCASSDNSSEDVTTRAFGFAAEQLDYALACTEEAIRLPENEEKRRYIPRTVEADGPLRLVGIRDWCSGFFPGTLWYMYEYSGDERWKQQATHYMAYIEGEKFDSTSHDVGFKMYNSFGNAYRLTGDPAAREVVLQSAQTLIRRYNPTVGAIRSWDFNRQVWDYPVIVDNMMNLELLFMATELSGDSTYYQIASRHAETTLREHFRADYSSYHVIDYDPETGDVRKRMTLQGYSDDSAWARGQAWGMYGFTMSYRFTRNPAFRERAEKIADFYFNHPNLPEDGIPYWDFDDPAIPEAPRDASAACVIASCLYELALYAPERAQYYREKAGQILENLNRHYQAEPGTMQGFLLLHSTGHLPGGSEIDVPISYADYYYLEALLRKQKTERGEKLF